VPDPSRSEVWFVHLGRAGLVVLLPLTGVARGILFHVGDRLRILLGL